MQATLTLPEINSYVYHGWLADVLIDWIGSVFPEKIESNCRRVDGYKGDEDDNFQAVNELDNNDNLEDKQDEQPRNHDELVGGSQAKRGNSRGVWGRCKFGGAPKIMGFTST